MSDTRFEYTRTWTNAADFPYLGFSRNWENPRDYPTFEPDEQVVRADMQSLHDETKTYINETLIPEMLAADATEKTREAAEEARLLGEQNRVAAEKSRVSAEQARDAAEQERESATRGVVAQAKSAAEAVKTEAVAQTTAIAAQAEQSAKSAAASAQQAATAATGKIPNGSLGREKLTPEVQAVLAGVDGLGEHWWQVYENKAAVGLVKSEDAGAYPHNAYRDGLFYEYLGVPNANAIRGIADLMSHWWEITKDYYEKANTGFYLDWQSSDFTGHYDMCSSVSVDPITGEITASGRESKYVYSINDFKGKYVWIDRQYNPTYMDTPSWVYFTDNAYFEDHFEEQGNYEATGFSGVQIIGAKLVTDVSLEGMRDGSAYPHTGTTTVNGVGKFTYKYLGVPFSNALNITETRLAELEKALADAHEAIAELMKRTEADK